LIPVGNTGSIGQTVAARAVEPTEHWHRRHPPEFKVQNFEALARRDYSIN
jgi:hypothetical protein